MLKELRIRHFATIDHLDLEFEPGLNVLTGETGAGKSIIIGALTLLLGGRADADVVRSGESKATVEGVFEAREQTLVEQLDEMGLEPEEDEIIIKRTLSPNGKTRCHINGSAVSVSILARLGDRLVDIHGQHAHQTLMRSECHRPLLDLYGKCVPGLERFRKFWNQYQDLTRQQKKLIQNEQDRLQREDLLKFQIGEIDQAQLSPGEEETLTAERNQFRHAEKLFQSLDNSLNWLREESGSILDQLGKVNHELRDLPSVDESLKPQVETGERLYYEIEELAESLKTYRQGLNFEPGRLEELEDRLAEIKGLQRKYGPDVESVLTYREKIGAELESLGGDQDRLEQLDAEIKALQEKVGQEAVKLAESREKSAKLLKKNAEKELKELDMKFAQFGVQFDYLEDPESFLHYQGRSVRLGAEGLGSLEFVFSSNPGESLRSLAKIASGGELSRVMLALKTLLNRQDTIPVLVFDEVDTGIGGKVAEIVGTKLKKLASSKQIFCITHLPQIAGMGNAHFRVLKEVEGKRTHTKVIHLDSNQRVEEIARMSAGVNITEATRQHAREMIK